jgi:hypothetical protein
MGENGLLAVIQGGRTGTISMRAGDATAIVVETLTSTSWGPGDGVPGASSGSVTQSTGLTDYGLEARD